jgi:hypothetical protein
MKLFSLIAFLCLLCLHAQGQDKPSVLIGNGGGVTGMATVYHITPSGEVFKGKGIGEIKYTECGKIKRAKAKTLISKVTSAVSSSTVNNPGNIYYFLALKENDGEKKITWGGTEQKVSSDIQTLFDEIQSVVAELKYKPIKAKK